MHITIHRGIDQIGGCICEIATGTSRVFIDMGDYLPGTDDLSESDKAAFVTGLFAGNRKEHFSPDPRHPKLPEVKKSA